jgi:outer membrane protein OmpA-like peptidoglycan-associated protein
MIRFNNSIAGLAIAIAGVQGCSSVPDRIDTLEQARVSVRTLQNEPLARDVAPTQFSNAQQALRLADDAYEEREPLETIEHNAYVALRNAQIAEQMIAEERARNELEQGEVERTRVQLQAREREAERAEVQAREAQALVERQTEQAEDVPQRAAELEQELADLKAEQTERGLVLTLDDVLFDTNRAVLNAGAASTIQRLTQFMNDYPERRILIEGHTDSTGSDEYNRDLSERRAQALRNALVERGIAIDRIITRGLGEMYPLASNDNAAGRQLNRRVEIVISDQQGQFPPASESRTTRQR